MKKQSKTFKIEPNIMYSLNHSRLTLEQFDILVDKMGEFGISRNLHYEGSDKRKLTTTFVHYGHNGFFGFDVHYTNSLPPKHKPVSFDTFMKIIDAPQLKIIVIGSYHTEVTAHYIKVGCTEVSFNTVERVYKEMLKLRKNK